MRTPLRPLALLAASALVLAGAACSEPDEPGDGRLTVYSGRSESLVKPVFEQFEKATGIKVEVRYASTAAMAAQLVEEGDGSPADLFYAQDAGALGAVAKQNGFAVLPDTILSQVPKAYRARGGEWVGVTGRARVMAYNVDQVPAEELPKSVFELTEPKWRGKVAIAPNNASFQAFVTALRVQHGDEKTREFLLGLKANDVQIRENNVLIVADVNAGKLASGLVNHYYVFGRAKEEGKSIDQLKVQLHYFPDGDIGALVNVSGVGVLRKAGTDPDAHKLVEYLLSAEAQKYFAEQTYEYPVRTEVPLAAELPALSAITAPDIDLNDLDNLQATIDLIKAAGLV